MLRSAQHYLLMRTTPNEPSPAMLFGSAVHTGILEPDTFGNAVAVAPDVNKRTNAGKAEFEAFAAENAGRIILSTEDHARALRCIDAVRAHPGAAKLLEGGERELSLFWNDGRYGVPCKARFDALNHGGVIDLKTCLDASPEAFARAAATFLYHVQAGHYLSAGEHSLHETPRFFVLICVESEAPHAVACYVLPSNAILAGQRLMNRALERYRDALAAGQWRGYPQTIETLPFPKWATTFAA